MAKVTNKFYRITYSKRMFKEPSIVKLSEHHALERANAICISCLTDGPQLTFVTEIVEKLEITRKPIIKYVEK